MNPQQPQYVNNPLSAMQPGEQVIFDVRRHPFGLIGMYISFALLLVIIAVLAIIAPNVLTDVDTKTIHLVAMLVFIAAVIFIAVCGCIAHIVYYGNHWILTNDSLTQVSQKGLFDKQNSQLSLANLEDISAYQDGILAHMFGFGLLKVETAGEHSKFSFPYCPNPNSYAQKILMAREAFEQKERYQNPGQQ